MTSYTTATVPSRLIRCTSSVLWVAAITALLLAASGSARAAPEALLACPICGDGIVDDEPGEQCLDPNGAEQCDPPDFITCDINCQLICGNGTLDTGEECDSPADDACPGECRTDCTCQVCGDGILDPGEECDDGTGNSDTTPNACRNDCTLPVCGDGIVDDEPGEQCDPPDGTDCDSMCQFPGFCGDGVIDPGEECDPPDGPEICDNMVDDTGNGQVDCADPLCQAFTDSNPFCGGLCVEGVCMPVRRDPAIIKLPRDGNTGYFRMHGRVDLEGRAVDPVGRGFGISIRNSLGEIWSAVLEPGDMASQGPRAKRFRYKDKAARNTGAGIRSGLYKVTTRLRRVNGADAYTFTIQAYSDDFALATEAEMTTQLYGVGGVGVLTAEWRPTGRGWKLRNVHLK